MPANDFIRHIVFYGNFALGIAVAHVFMLFDHVASRIRSRTRPRPQRNIDHASHAHGAVGGAEVIKRPIARKSDAVFRSSVRKNSLATVRPIGRTKPSVSDAINAASDTVAITGPCPAHRVALDYV